MPSVKLTQDPLWYKDAIIYEVHVKSFFDSNQDGIGDFPGLIQKLDYLQDLGITCLWILPFYPSPLRDDGYDISDYRGVHPSYGTRRDFHNLVREAHRRGIRVVTELVINHTSDQHPWFQAARKAPPGSAKRNFYVWSNTDQKYKDARIIFKDSEKSNWTWDPIAKAYYWHRFFFHQPDLNFDNPLVRRAIMKVMRFWLDMGVDGLRLDAVPYLIERDGTNCENLAETHALLKDMRRELDANYKGRMFLAEANQWPADVRPYFGDGDECHMAFHFPLMPRIFMALRQEDRHPITDILQQTPDIPESCQWAIFLRNHDELTLEMVTDQERDYMYNEYAVDPLMRLNLGIRRRLAPLVGNSRRRLELLYSLLFSFPGTPVIYYGDEIGMGDNFYLGDRNGVRTPMQWSDDRNGGFSRADFAQLYSPPIMDSIYSYHSVNVEAQQRDPSSLLNWMKRMIAVSKRFKTFGRGRLEFLNPTNRKVLAYVRKYQDETFLAVANLSRFVQPAELTLAEFEGRMPVEMLGRVEFPRVGKLPYFLTLGPHSFYWFQLQKVAAPVVATTPVPAPARIVAEDPELTSVGSMEEFWQGETGKIFERVILPGFLIRQRWYAAKAEKLEKVRVLDWAWVKKEEPQSGILFVEVELAGSRRQTYVVPLAVAKGAGAEAFKKQRPEAIVAPVKGLDQITLLIDGMADDAFCSRLLQLIEEGQGVAAAPGKVTAVRSAHYAELRGDPREALPVNRSSAEQSNTSIRYGRRLILKLYRTLGEGINPDYEMTRYLTETAGFTRVPRIAGAIEWRDKNNSASTLAVVQELVENQGDGWTHTLDELARYFERATGQLATIQSLDPEMLTPAKLAEVPQLPVIPEFLGSYLYSAGLLGKRTGEMHLALSRASGDAAFNPESFSPEDFKALEQRIAKDAKRILLDLGASAPHLPASLTQPLADLKAVCASLGSSSRIAAFETIPKGRIRCHGDFHLGQVLWVNNDFILLDFEGEPARPFAERRQKQSPLKDVASMLRSFHYAAYAGLFKAAAERPADIQKFEPAARLWHAYVVNAYLKEYRSTVAGAGIVPEKNQAFEELLDLFLIEKAFYEVHYELNNRPTWLGIPIQGLLSLKPQPSASAVKG